MKKLYTTLIAVAVVALSASAASLNLPAKANKSGKAMLSSSTRIMTEAPAMKKQKAKAPVMKTISSAADVVGFYDFGYIYYDTSSDTYWTYYSSPLEIKAVEGSSTDVILDNFWDRGIDGVKGVVDAAAGTLTIPKQSIYQRTLQISETETALCDLVLCLAGVNEQNYMVEYDEPIVIDIDEDGTLLYEGIWGIALHRSDNNEYLGFWDFCQYMDAIPCNAQMVMTVVSEEPEEYINNVNVYKTGNKLELHNIFGLGFDNTIEFTVDPAVKTATAVDQVVLTAEETGTYDYLFVSTDGYDVSTSVVAAITGDNNNVIMFDDYIAFYIAENSNALFFSGAKITTNLDLINGADFNSVESIAADDNSAAAVEYFNLQGVKVNNPVAGGLYIRRQGTDVQKVIVK